MPASLFKALERLTFNFGLAKNFSYSTGFVGSWTRGGLSEKTVFVVGRRAVIVTLEKRCDASRRIKAEEIFEG